MPLTGSYDLRLVALSVLVAILAAGAALDLTARVTTGRGQARLLWLTGGACAMGLGIWSMHYTGMLAFLLPVPVAYHVPTVMLSLLAAILASGVALYVASREQLRAPAAVAGSVVMGSGIAAMHYTGMAAASFTASAGAVDLGETVSSSVLGAYAVSAGTLLVLFVAIATSVLDRRFAAQAAALAAALAEVKTLRGLLPICASCKGVRTDQGGWEQIESYVRERTNAEFSHGICPECAAKVYGVTG